MYNMPGHGAEPCETGFAAPAQLGPEPGDHHSQEDTRHADDYQPVHLMYVLLKEFQDRPSAERSPRICRSAAARSARDPGDSVRWAADRRPGYDRRLQTHHQGSHQTATAGSSCKRSASRSWLGATTPRCSRTWSTVPGRTPLAVPGRRSRPVPRARVQASDVFSALQVYLGSYYVNNFNQFGRTWQVNVQADPLYRTRVRDIPPAPGAQSDGADDPVGLLLSIRNEGGPVSLMRYNMYSAPPSGTRPARTSRGRRPPRWRRLPIGKCPGKPWRGSGPSWRTCKSRRGTKALFVFAWRGVRLSSAGGPVRELVAAFGVILVVPMCCSVPSRRDAGRGEVNVFTQIGSWC